MMADPLGLQRLYGEDYFKQYKAAEDTPQYRQRVEMYRQEYARLSRHVSGGRVLDVGCGLGDFLQLFDPSRWERYGIEVSDHARGVAASRGVRCDVPPEPEEFFDLVVFRGTIQHLDEPVRAVKDAVRRLKPGGHIVFLATPNIGGICYRLFQEHPALSPRYNYMLVSDRILRQILENLGMEVVKFEFPYLGSPYARPGRDLWRFLLRCLGIRRPFAFWGNMLECYARKPTGMR